MPCAAACAGGNAHRYQSKKLKEAARYWATGGKVKQGELADDFKAFGATPEQVSEFAGKDDSPAVFAIEPENDAAMRAFVSMETQWRVSVGMRKVYHGLDYNAIEPTLRLLALPPEDWPQIFLDLRILETEALPLLNQT